MVSLLAETAPGTALDFRPCDGFDDLLVSVVDGRIGVAMVWDEVLARHPDEAQATKVLMQTSDPPAPLVFVRGDVAARGRRNLQRALFEAPADAGWFFDGFTEPNQQDIGSFARDLDAVVEHFDLASTQG